MTFSATLKVFSTCPQSRSVPREDYPDAVAEIARWSERAGCEGVLVYTDNGIVDPWLVSQLVIQATDRLCPLVAVQPAYLHPYAVAKLVASFAHLHGRRTYLNMVAGGFRGDLLSLGDPTPHDERYARLIEYTEIVSRLVSGTRPVTFEGRHYQVQNLRLTPPVPEDRMPGITISGSSQAGLDAAQVLGATAISYPGPAEADEELGARPGLEIGIRVGIIAREDSEAAWRVALERFPEDRLGQLTHELAMRTSDSQWHRRLSDQVAVAQAGGDPYWLGPFHNYKTFCPYLVGDHQTVGRELARYLARGVRTVILDIPSCEEDLHHAAQAFAATAAVPAP